MEADILESKKDPYLVQKYGGQYFEKVLFINLCYSVVSIGIATCSIVMDVSIVIEAAERHLIYFVATELMSLWLLIVFILWCICSLFIRVFL